MAGNGGFRYLAVAELLQKDIESGKYGIGAKLPSERFLAQDLKVSYLTVRQGVDMLVRKGLVRREMGSGTYVNATKSDPIIGILFGPSMVEESAHFYRALLKMLEQEVAGMSFTARCYDGFNRTDAEKVEESWPYQQLLRDSQSHPVHGYIKVSLRDDLWNELKPIKGVPSASSSEINQDVITDYSYFGRRTLEYCVKRGCRDIVYLRNFLNHQGDLGGLGDMAKKLKVPMPEVVGIEENDQPLDLIAHDAIARLTERWRREKRRPDALIVTDDIATRGAAIALIKAGIKVPEEMLVVSMANEGINHHYGIDVVRYYFSPRELAEKLVSVLQSRMSGKAVKVPLIMTGHWQKSPQDHKSKLRLV
jgi:DNA-binding transcriptional regulator YhcF (GntR family)